MHAPGFCSPAVMKSEPLAWWQRQTSACACVALNRPTVKHRRREAPIRDMKDSTLYLAMPSEDSSVSCGLGHRSMQRCISVLVAMMVAPMSSDRLEAELDRIW